MVAATRGKRFVHPNSCHLPLAKMENHSSFSARKIDTRIIQNFAKTIALPFANPLISHHKWIKKVSLFAPAVYSNVRLRRGLNFQRSYSFKIPIKKEKQLTSAEKEKIKGFIEQNKFDEIEELVRQLKASSLTDISFFLGQEFYQTAQQFLAIHPPEKLEKKEVREVKRMLYYAEKYLASCGHEEGRDLLPKIYYILGKIAFPKNNYEAVFYYNQALKHLSYKYKQINLPDYDWDLGPIEVMERIPSEFLPEINTALGKAVFLEGNLVAAQNYFERAIHQDSKNVEALVHIGCLAWMKKGFAESGKYFDQAFSKNRVEASKLITEAIFFTLPHVLCCANLDKKRKAVLEAPIVYPDVLMNYIESVKTYDHLVHTDPGTSKSILEECQKVFHVIHSSLENPQLRSALTAEILLKEVAFHSPRKGKEFLLPPSQAHQDMLAYKVDEVIHLRGKIPAYGLTSSNPHAAPILIYRGTSPALSREGGISSLIEDLDPKGVGRQIFDQAFPRLNSWLEKATEKGKKARILGYSQGASLAALTLVHSFRMISKDPSFPSITFNPPGIDHPALETWKKIPVQQRPLMIQYLIRGDLVSRCGGALIGEAYEITTAQKLGLLDAHVSLVLPQSHWKMHQVDIEKDNQATLRQFAAGFVETEYGVNLYELLQTHPAANILLKINALTSNPTIGQGINYAVKLGSLVGKLLQNEKTEGPKR